MTFRILGSASGVPVLSRSHAAVLAEAAGDCVLLDAGEGVARAFLRYGIPWDRPRAVYISHTHADHVSGLPMLLQAMHLAGRTVPLQILLPPGREEWCRSWLRGMYVFEEKWRFPLLLGSLEDARDGALRVEALRNSHLDGVRELAARHGIPAEACSFSISHAGRSALVSADLGSAEDIRDACGGAELLIVDATHVPPEEVEALQKEFPQLRIVATHVPPELEEVAAADREHTWAADGMGIVMGEEIRYE